MKKISDLIKNIMNDKKQKLYLITALVLFLFIILYLCNIGGLKDTVCDSYLLKFKNQDKFK